MPNVSDQRKVKHLLALANYDLVDTPPELSLERVTRLVSRIFAAPMAAVSLSEYERQTYRATVGFKACDIPREGTFCDMATRQSAAVAVADTLLDDRFANAPFVVSGPKIRFYAGAPLRTPNGHCIGLICIMDTIPRDIGPDKLETLSDLADIAMHILELRRLATTDSLTGAMQRRGFVDAANQTIALARRHHHELTVLSFDLDHFKGVNDCDGHAVGDTLLRACVAVCRSVLRASDIIGRLGGEEFSIVLPLTGAEGGLRVAEKLRVAIEALSVPIPSGQLHITASFGVATFGPSCSDLDTLMRHADLALYSAKNGGRNRSVAAFSGDDIPRQGSSRMIDESPPSIVRSLHYFTHLSDSLLSSTCNHHIGCQAHESG